MSLFDTILEKLGIKKPAASSTAASQTASSAHATSTTTVTPSKPAAATPQAFDAYSVTHPTSAQPVQPAPAKPATPTPMPMVDVVSKLNKMAADSGQKLDWKVSIVDLMKVLHMDSSFEARKELATELGCPDALMTDSAKMNTWLHKTVLQKISENGGNIPESLLK